MKATEEQRRVGKEPGCPTKQISRLSDSTIKRKELNLSSQPEQYTTNQKQQTLLSCNRQCKSPKSPAENDLSAGEAAAICHTSTRTELRLEFRLQNGCKHQVGTAAQASGGSGERPGTNWLPKAVHSSFRFSKTISQYTRLTSKVNFWPPHVHIPHPHIVVFVVFFFKDTDYWSGLKKKKTKQHSSICCLHEPHTAKRHSQTLQEGRKVTC